MSSLAKVNRVLEIFWWSMAAVTFILVTVFSMMDGLNKWMFYYLVPVLAALMALMRRFMNKKLTKSEAIKAERESKNKA